MRRINVVLLAAMLVAAGLLATPALAEHELEHSPSGQQEVRSWALPPGYMDESQVYVWGLGSPIGLYGFMGFCYNDGGYWYWGADGWYWHSC
jgi:hypothetical protein